MFLVDKDGMKIRKIELKDVDMCLDFDEETKNTIHAIFNSAYEKVKYVGSVDFVIKDAEREADNYLEGKKPITKIYINKEFFGEYPAEKGKKIFGRIVSAIKNGCDFLDMSVIRK